MRLPFELDPQIIHHIIYSQAGSIGKAIIEVVINSVDAGATSVALEINSEGFSCKDDGQGFASRDDVLRYFGRLVPLIRKATRHIAAFDWDEGRLWRVPASSGVHAPGR
jgi:hypothetical protein